MRCTEETLTPIAFSHRSTRPVGGFGRRLHGQRYDALRDGGVEFRDARGPRLVAQQPFDALNSISTTFKKNVAFGCPTLWAPSGFVFGRRLRGRLVPMRHYKLAKLASRRSLNMGRRLCLDFDRQVPSLLKIPSH
jgi:hypothetical protein